MPCVHARGFPADGAPRPRRGRPGGRSGRGRDRAAPQVRAPASLHDLGPHPPPSPPSEGDHARARRRADHQYPGPARSRDRGRQVRRRLPHPDARRLLHRGGRAHPRAERGQADGGDARSRAMSAPLRGDQWGRVELLAHPRVSVSPARRAAPRPRPRGVELRHDRRPRRPGAHGPRAPGRERAPPGRPLRPPEGDRLALASLPQAGRAEIPGSRGSAAEPIASSTSPSAPLRGARSSSGA